MGLKSIKPAISSITFNADGDESWVMKLTREGILFNRDTFPDSTPDAFAKAVVEILENQFTVKFERIEPPYDRKNEAVTK